MKSKFWILLVISVIMGLLIARIDTRPNWDDTAITVSMLILVTGTLGTIMPSRARVWALAIGVWIPVFNVFLANNYESIFSLAFPFIGAYAGVFIRKTIKTTD